MRENKNTFKNYPDAMSLSQIAECLGISKARQITVLFCRVGYGCFLYCLFACLFVHMYLPLMIMFVLGGFLANRRVIPSLLGLPAFTVYRKSAIADKL